jgi:hypothetical protein
MKLKTISVEELALATAEIVNAARKQPVVVRVAGKPAMILRELVEDDAVDELIVGNPSFRAGIRRARGRRALGKGIPLAEARRQLKL